MFNQFAPLLNLFKPDNVCIDGNVFRLNYQFTAIIFLSASLLVTSKQFFGDPIDCIVDGVPSDVMDTYCWIHSTFTIPSHLSGKDVPYPGVGPLTDDPEDVSHHKYYQWVCFVLFFQAACFYGPKFLWQTEENGKIQLLTQDLQDPIISEDLKKRQIENIVNYFDKFHGTHTSYAVKYFLCELLSFVNVIGQIFFIDKFLGGQFLTYGRDVLKVSELEPDDRVDPMSKIFPKMTKCTFHLYGPSGPIENRDGLCVLALNNINEKIYIFVWFWLVILAALTAILIVIRIILVLDPSSIRATLLSARGGSSRMIRAILNQGLTRSQRFGDWFVLYLLFKNLDFQTADALIRRMHENVQENNNVLMKKEPSLV